MLSNRILLKSKRAQLKYTGSIQERHLSRKRKKKIKKIIKANNIKALKGGRSMVYGFEENGL
jgi:hypothetical protein